MIKVELLHEALLFPSGRIRQTYPAMEFGVAIHRAIADDFEALLDADYATIEWRMRAHRFPVVLVEPPPQAYAKPWFCSAEALGAR